MSVPIDTILPEVLRLLAVQAGMAAESFGTAAIAHALHKRIAAAATASADDYLRRLAAEPAEFQELLEELVVPETWFYRDPPAFRCLARRIGNASLPRGERLRVLCVACSTGEEVYSLAITLREAGLAPEQFYVVGADISRRALDLARKGAYPPRSFRERNEEIAALCHRWCEPLGESRQVRDELRAGVEFCRGQLWRRPEFLAGVPPFHVIFCRNVLIYFHAEARRIAVGRLQELLRPEGLLCSAPVEARIFSEAGFSTFGSECPYAFMLREENVANGKCRLALPDCRLSLRESVAALPEQKATIAEPAAKQIPEEPSNRAALQAAKQAADEGRLNDADTLCAEVLLHEPASAEAHYLHGVVRQARGAIAEAQRSLEKALYLDPKHYQALVHMMLLAEQHGDHRAAENYRRRAQELASPEVA